MPEKQYYIVRSSDGLFVGRDGTLVVREANATRFEAIEDAQIAMRKLREAHDWGGYYGWPKIIAKGVHHG